MKNFPELDNYDEKKYTSNNEVLPNRLNILFGVAAFLLALLVIKLAMLTIVSGDYYKQLVNRTDVVTEKQAVPRGLIYDSRGNIITNNTPAASITYTRSQDDTPAKMFTKAGELSKYIDISTDGLTSRQQIDYYLANQKNYDKTLKSLNLTNKEANSLTGAQVQDRLVKKLQKDKLKLSDGNKKKAAIYNKMAGTPALSTSIIKDTDVSNDEIAKVGERQSLMRGVSVAQNWKRTKSDDESLQALIGGISSTTSGLPDSQLRKMLALGYSRNARIGVSGIEQQWEESLKGIDKVDQVSTSGNNNQTTVSNPGFPGGDLHVTINSDFQNAVQKTLDKYLPRTGLATGAYAVAMNPYNGAIYAMGGLTRDNKTGEVTTNPLGAISTPILMGSAVKPAMLANAFQRNIITPTSSTMNDQTIQIQGSNKIQSYFNQTDNKVPLTAEQALEVSSNTYMVQLALNMNGTPYREGMGIGVSKDIWSKMRNGFEQFGLGVKTGIDLPGESAGSQVRVTDDNIAQFIYASFGQFDAYTVIQMARYVSAIANGGSLVTPHVVDSVTRTSNNGITQQIYSAKKNPTSRVELTPDQWQVIKQGMYNVANGNMTGNTGRSTFGNQNPKVLVKTGTAEAYTQSQLTLNTTAIMFVPDQPIAIAIAFPNLGERGSTAQLKAGAEILDAYWQYVQERPEG